jgi:hypothetical protein
VPLNASICSGSPSAKERGGNEAPGLHKSRAAATHLGGAALASLWQHGSSATPETASAGSLSSVQVPMLRLGHCRGSQLRLRGILMQCVRLCSLFESVQKSVQTPPPPPAQIYASDSKTCTDGFLLAHLLHLHLKPPFFRSRRVRL